MLRAAFPSNLKQGSRAEEKSAWWGIRQSHVSFRSELSRIR